MPASDPGPRSCAPQGADPSWLTLDVVFEDEDWPDAARMEALVREAAATMAADPAMHDLAPAGACIALSNDAHVQSLNASFRGKDKPTNVLSFPAPESRVPQALEQLGDVIIARETLEREAADKGIPLADHLRHLTIHGLLHLLGYDHEDEAEALEMENIETGILSRLGIPDPYSDRDS
jgi:probable rRNA maturation factor